MIKLKVAKSTLINRLPYGQARIPNKQSIASVPKRINKPIPNYSNFGVY